MTVPAKNASPAPVVSITFTFFGGYNATFAIRAGVHRAFVPHGNNHAGDAGAAYISGQRAAHFLRPHMVVFVRKEDPRFLLVADKTVDLLQKVTPLHGNAHVGNRGIYLFVVFLCKIQDLLYSVFFQIKFNGNAIAVLKNFIAFFRPAGRSGGLVSGRLEMAATTSPLIIEHSQPGAHAVRHALDIAGVHLVARQFINNILPCASVIHQAYKGGAQLHVGDILRHIAAHTAVYLFYPPGVAPARNIGGKGGTP